MARVSPLFPSAPSVQTPGNHNVNCHSVRNNTWLLAETQMPREIHWLYLRTARGRRCPHQTWRLTTAGTDWSSLKRRQFRGNRIGSLATVADAMTEARAVRTLFDPRTLTNYFGRRLCRWCSPAVVHGTRRKNETPDSMHPHVAVGCALTVAALATVIWLYVWSVRIIERIRRSKLKGLRQIQKELKNRDG